MGNYFVVASILPASGIEADAAQNGFALVTNKSPVIGGTLDFVGPIDTFYNAIGGSLSNSHSRAPGGIRYKIYEVTGQLDGDPSGSPVATDTGHLLAPVSGGPALPDEVAVVLTLRGAGWDGQPVEAPDGADPDSNPDRPRQRRTGRIYLGPLTGGIQDGFGNRPDTARLTAIRNAAKDMYTSWQAQPIPILWSVWSRKNAAMYATVRVETDNAFDTQRRRGVAPTIRVGTLMQ